MPSVGRQDPSMQRQNEVIHEANKQYEELQEVYSKKALDETFTTLMGGFKRLQEENEEMRNAIQKINIKIIHTSPLKKFMNLFRGD